jgi:hypothetical protein
MNDEYCYFIAGGRVLETIAAFYATNDVHRAHMQAIADDLGCTKLWSQGSRVVGFEKAGAIEPLPGMRFEKGTHGKMQVPHLKTAFGKALALRMKEAPPSVSNTWVCKTVGLEIVHYFTGGGMISTSCGWETFGDVVVFITRKDQKGESLGGTPFDSEPIQTSRYYQIKEAFEASEKATS